MRRAITGMEPRGVAIVEGAEQNLGRASTEEVPPDFEEQLRTIEDLDRLYEILEQVPKARSASDLDLD